MAWDATANINASRVVALRITAAIIAISCVPLLAHSSFAQDTPAPTYVCTNTLSCNGRSLNSDVAYVNGSCQCAPCQYNWTGPECQLCPQQYDPSTCADCNIDNQYVGTWPNCYSDVCNISEWCNVTNTIQVLGTVTTGCKCQCRNKWSGPKCSTCPEGLNATNQCGSCMPGWFGYPSCSPLCTVIGNCSGHASDVSGTWASGCTCKCATQWYGLTCESCPLGFNASENCATCSAGFSGYPNCSRSCTAADCNNNSKAVSGTAQTGCKCTCANQWYGATCGKCPFGMNATAGCDRCIDGYSGFPNCSLTCTADANCSSHASSVSGTSLTGCSCVCRNQWTDCRNQWNGKQCGTCAANYSSAADCGACAAGYTNYPLCPRRCNVVTDCSNHALNVSGWDGSCVCQCRNQWSGPACSQCSSQFSIANDCGACATGYDTYPGCYLTCTTAANCSGHATGVSGNAQTGCRCGCRNAWSGDDCAVCPPNVNATLDCAVCFAGFGGYPNCRRTCTSAADCSGHAIAVSGLEPTCSCTCRGQWNGSSCDTCASQFNASLDCSACSLGYDSYPGCFLSCTTEANCSDHASSVTGNSLTGCACHCRNQWSTPSCGVCAPQFNSSLDCGDCAVGYALYPTCQRICTIDEDCNGNADNVTGLFPNCKCSCRNQWSGASCATCPVQYNRSADCSGCASAYDGEYPACYLTCTRAANCSGHAATVTGNANTGCNCTCRNMWQDSACATCPDHFDPSQNCGACAEGYGYYPNCTRVCSTLYECSGHASTVSGDFPNCTCACRNQWLGANCSVCPSMFNRSTVNDCGTCTDDREGYPICVQKCTNAKNCSNHAQTVSGNYTSGCKCECRNRWSGASCESCPAGFDASLDCGACLSGYRGYPNCAPLCTPSDCYNHSLRFSGTRPNCACTCKNQWSLSNCSLCPDRYDASADCGACAAGFEGYPTCSRICTVAQDCTGHAISVRGNVSSGCVCTCRNQWSGPACDVCPPRYNATEDCQTCAMGYFNDFPNCTRICTVDEDCNGNAWNASGLAGSCLCECRNQWTGPSCRSCPPKYDWVRDCGACEKHREDDYPNCTGTSRTLPTVTLGAESFSLSVTQSESPSRSVSLSPSPTETSSGSRSPGSASGTDTVSPEVHVVPPTSIPTPIPTASPLTSAPSTTATTPPPTSSTVVASTAVTTTLPPSTFATAPATNTTTSSTVPVTEVVSSTNTPVASTTGSPVSTTSTLPTTSTTSMATTTITTATPSTQIQPTTVAPTPSTTTTPLSTAAPSTWSPSTAAACGVAVCNGRGVSASMVDGVCTCTCRNQWSPITQCATCPSVFSGADCGACAEGRFQYPWCDAVHHVIANVSLNCSLTAMIQRANGGSAALLSAVAADVLSALRLSSAVTNCIVPPLSDQTRQLLAVGFVAGAMPNGSWVGVDIQVFAANASALSQASSCLASYVRDGLRPRFSSLTALLDSAVDADGTCSAVVSGATATESSPCGDVLCAPGLGSRSAAPTSSFPWYAVVVPLLLIALIVAAVLLYKGKIGTLAFRQRRARAYVDSGKYTIEFLPDMEDADLKIMTRERAVEADNGADHDHEAKSRRPTFFSRALSLFVSSPAAAEPTPGDNELQDVKEVLKATEADDLDAEIEAFDLHANRTRKQSLASEKPKRHRESMAFHDI